ncbi:MAG: Mu transposase domain-containing protein, partial [Candidatus Saccharimonadales bacterium]
RVERAIRYVRDNFFACRHWKNLEDLNTQATDWCDRQASDRRCPEDTSLSVRETFYQEQPKLFSLPDNPYPTVDREEVSVGKTPYVRFDLNDYSVPHTHVRRTLTVMATTDKVSIADGHQVIAEHVRSYDKKQQIELEAHIKALVDVKKQSHQHRGQDRLTKAISSGAAFLREAAKRGYNLRSTTASLLQLLDSYGANELEVAINEALLRKVPHQNAVRWSLEKHREERQKLPPVYLDLPRDARVRELVVRPHKLGDYDQLNTSTENTKDGN